MTKTDYVTNRILTQDTIYVQYQKRVKAPNIEHPHVHHGYEIYYLHSGLVNYVIGNTLYTLSSGDMLVFRGDLLHLVQPAAHVPYLRSIINFRAEDIRFAFAPPVHRHITSLFDAHGGKQLHWTQEESEKIEHLFYLMAQESRQREIGYQNIICAQLTTLLLRILRKQQSILSKQRTFDIPSSREANIEQALKILNRRFRERLTLEQIASEVHLNKHYLCHCFKQVTGMTINQYLAKKRIVEGKKLLVETSKPIGVIAEEVGAGVLAQFSRLFRQQVGMSPQAYRRKHERAWMSMETCSQ